MKELLRLLHRNYFTFFTKQSHRKYSNIFSKFKDYTMIDPNKFIKNLMIVDMYSDVKGVVVECGTWRGGMIGGIATILGNNRTYYLFDSFEGLPEAKAIDGDKATLWQNDKDSKHYFDNCKAEMEYAERAMKIANISNPNISKGWFSDTLPLFDKATPIAFLRLDGDWYDSTMDCLDNLFDSVVKGGIILIDDYYTWEGCTKAVHDFLSKRKSPIAIRQWDNSVAYMIKD
jgi:O-methyltransferase